MGIDFVNIMRRSVAEEAMSRQMRNIPQLQIPYVEFVVPKGQEPEGIRKDMEHRMSNFPNVDVRIVKTGSLFRIRMTYKT